MELKFSSLQELTGVSRKRVFHPVMDILYLINLTVGCYYLSVITCVCAQTGPGAGDRSGSSRPCRRQPP